MDHLWHAFWTLFRFVWICFVLLAAITIGGTAGFVFFVALLALLFILR